MITFSSADDVFALLIHLGYLGYDFKTKEIFIPNMEISYEFCIAIESSGWDKVVNVIKKSDALLASTIARDYAAG